MTADICSSDMEGGKYTAETVTPRLVVTVM